MGALLLLFVCLLLGMLVARVADPPRGMAKALNWWVLYVALPAIVLKLIPTLHFQSELWFPIAATWVVFGGAWILFSMLGRWRGWSRARIGTMVLACGLGNTSFMGFPLIHALHGDAGLKLAVVSDQLGSFLLLTTVAIVVASLYAGQKPRLHHVARRILTFPAFIALVVAIVAGQFGGWPSVLDQVLGPIGATLTPLALFSVGLQFRFGSMRGQSGVMATGLGWKLLLGPFLAWGLGVALGVHGLVLTVGVLEAAMAPMVSATIMIDEYDLDADLANSLLGLGVLISLVSVPLGNLLLGG